MYKPSKIKAPSGKNKKKNGDPAYASNNTAAEQPAFAETTASGPESSRDKSESQTPDRPAEETRKPVVNEDEQKKVVNQSSSSSAAAYDDSEES